MNRLALPAFVILSLGGCIIYDEDVVYRNWDTAASFDDPPSTRPVRPGRGDDADPTDAPDATTDDAVASTSLVGIYPPGAPAGETIILSIVRTDDPGSEAYDLRELTGLGFFGPSDLEVLVVQARTEAESLMTVEIAPGSRLGSNDLLLEFSNGDALFIEDAFTVHAAGSVMQGDPIGADACPG
jgi:hypothetical protein